MGKKLDDLIDKSIDLKMLVDNLKLTDDKSEFFRNAAKEKLTKEIMDEIREEIVSEAFDEIEQKVEEGRLRRKIQDFKLLTVLGVILSFLVGLAVNQTTELIVSWKGPNNCMGTIILTLFIIVVIMAIVIYHLFKNIEYKV